MSEFHYDITRTDHYSLKNATLYGESVQDGTPTPGNPVDVRVVCSPNLIPYDIDTIKTYNTSGSWNDNVYTFRTIQATFNEDGTITLNGTASGTYTLYLVPNSNQLMLPDGNYTFTGELPGTGSDSTWYFQATTTTNSSGTVKARNRDYGSGVTFAVDSAVYGVNVYLHAATGDTFNNAVLKPQLIASSQIEPFVPYSSIALKVGSTVTSIDLQGNVLASLPDGTKDVLTVDSAGAVTLTKRVGKYTITGLESYGSNGQYGSYYRIIINPPLSGSAEAVPRVNSSGYCTHAPYVPNASEQSVHVYANSGTIGLFALGTTAAEVQTAYTDAVLYYKLLNEQTIDLGTIDISHLQDTPTEIPVSFVTSLTPDSSYSYENDPSYEIENPYEDHDAPEYAFPPNHPGQEWETFDANEWNKADMLDYTGQFESHAVYTVELCELMQSGAFDWSRPELDWSEAAYDQEQYERFCSYFEQRFMFREISMLPPLHWFTAFRRMMVYELMPKYKPLYAQVANGISPLGENEYYKERHVTSAYPETLLSGNSDYISSGEDREFERIKIDNAAEALEAYRNGYRSVDAALGDELEVLFVSMYTSYVNGL